MEELKVELQSGDANKPVQLAGAVLTSPASALSVRPEPFGRLRAGFVEGERPVLAAAGTEESRWRSKRLLGGAAIALVLLGVSIAGYFLLRQGEPPAQLLPPAKELPAKALEPGWLNEKAIFTAEGELLLPFPTDPFYARMDNGRVGIQRIAAYARQQEGYRRVGEARLDPLQKKPVSFGKSAEWKEPSDLIISFPWLNWDQSLARGPFGRVEEIPGLLLLRVRPDGTLEVVRDQLPVLIPNPAFSYRPEIGPGGEKWDIADVFKWKLPAPFSGNFAGKFAVSYADTGDGLEKQEPLVQAVPALGELSFRFTAIRRPTPKEPRISLFELDVAIFERIEDARDSTLQGIYEWPASPRGASAMLWREFVSNRSFLWTVPDPINLPKRTARAGAEEVSVEVAEGMARINSFLKGMGSDLSVLFGAGVHDLTESFGESPEIQAFEREGLKPLLVVPGRASLPGASLESPALNLLVEPRFERVVRQQLSFALAAGIVQITANPAAARFVVGGREFVQNQRDSRLISRDAVFLQIDFSTVNSLTQDFLALVAAYKPGAMLVVGTQAEQSDAVVLFQAA